MRELQALRPATFQAPPDAQVREVQAEVLVKVCVEGFERFWVQVEQVEWPHIIGRVNNVLDSTPAHGLKYNDRLQFHWENVYQVTFPWQSVLG